MKYISIDTETTGINPELDQVLEIGAIIEDTNKLLSFEDLPKFHVILLYDRYHGTPYAINMNKRIWEILSYVPPKGTPEFNKYCAEHRIIPASEAAHHFNKWLKEWGFNTNPVAAGKNVATFDIPFLNNLPNWKENVKFHQRVIEPGSVMIDWKNDEIPPSSDECKRRALLPSTEYKHNALEDAWEMIQILRSKYV
jgi:DNA polymerase III epsilon subunit-like protein